MSEERENHDRHVYGWVMFYRETIEFLIRALEFYGTLLVDEDKELKKDPDLHSLITEETRRDLRLGRDTQTASRAVEWLKEQLEKRGNSHDISLTLSHWDVRYFKSVAFLYLANLKKKRNVLASRPNVTAVTLSALDREITSKEELFSSVGVFKDASELPLLVPISHIPEGQRAGNDESLLDVRRPRPVVLDSIQILDQELRARCLDLLGTFHGAGQDDRNDTVVAEASRILEDRLRRVARVADGTTAAQIVTTAFAGDRPRLIVSRVKAEQEAAHHLFRGTFGYIRNQVQHKLLGAMPSERALQILGWVDYLLTVISRAELDLPEELG